MRFAPDLHTPVGLGVVKGTRLDGGLHEASEKPLLGSGCRFSARDPRCGAERRANSGAGKQRGQDRAEQVQNENKKGDKDRSKDGRSHGKHEGWEKKGKHKAKVHS